MRTSDGGYLFSGLTDSYGAGGYDAMLVKVDGNGDPEWSRTFGGNGDDLGNALRRAPSGGFVLAGHTESYGFGDFDAFLMKVDSAGNLKWAKHYGGSGDDRAMKLEVTTDGGFIMAGESRSFGPGDRDLYLIKTDSIGTSGCHEGSFSPSVNSPSLNLNAGGSMATQNDVNDPSTVVNKPDDSLNVLCKSVPGYTVRPANDTGICAGDRLSLQGDPWYQDYDWSPSASLNDPNIPDPIASPDSTTSYVLQASRSCFHRRDSTTIRVLKNANAEFGTERKASCEGMRVRYLDQSANADAHRWKIGKEKGIQEEKPLRTHPYGKELTVSLIASNQGRCRDTVERRSRMSPFEKQFEKPFPNVFTPNDDGRNDLFSLRLDKGIQECATLRIYNRWGQLIYVSKDYPLTWDGRTREGEKVPAGTYFYNLQVKKFKTNGDLELFY